MTEIDEKILVREIGKLAGCFGGPGAKLAARFLPVEEREVAIEINANVATVRASTSELLQTIGRLIDDSASQNMAATLSAVVGSGHMNLNPTIVHVEFTALSQASSKVVIRCIAKEGLVKQDSAAKALERIKNLLLSEYA